MGLKEEINSLIEPGNKTTTLAAANERDQIPSQINRSVLTETSAGINSPLTEQSRITETRMLADSTNTIFIEVEDIMVLNMTDATGLDVVLNLVPPT